jgi:hypothetical protein
MNRSSSFSELESCSGSSINGQTAHLLLEGDRTYGGRREIDEIEPKQASGVFNDDGARAPADFAGPVSDAANDKGKSRPTMALNGVSGAGLKLRQRLFGELPGQVSGGQGATEMRRLARPQRREVSRSRAFRLSAQRRQSGAG